MELTFIIFHNLIRQYPLECLIHSIKIVRVNMDCLHIDKIGILETPTYFLLHILIDTAHGTGTVDKVQHVLLKRRIVDGHRWIHPFTYATEMYMTNHIQSKFEISKI